MRTTRGGVAALLLTAAAVPPRCARAQAAAADSAAIRAAALDYIEGWYAGDSARMRRAVHPQLAKRVVEARGATSGLENMGADALVSATGRGGGRRTPAAEQRKDVAVLGVFGNAASARVNAADWVDYLHLAKLDGRWVIVNVLWEPRPRRQPSSR